MSLCKQTLLVAKAGRKRSKWGCQYFKICTLICVNSGSLLVRWESTCSCGTCGCGGIWCRSVLSYVNIFPYLSAFEQMFINLNVCTVHQ